MSVSTELQSLNDNLLDAYNAVSAKSGTVPANKNTDNLASAIASIPAGGGATRPSTWSEFAAMTVSQQQAIYGVGDRVGITCSWVSPKNSRQYPDLVWEIANWGTTRKENDATQYPCVTLIARLGTQDKYTFDAPETPLAATEETAQSGIYYFGYNGSTYTSLNLSTGDTIPYGSYTAVYKTDVTNDDLSYTRIRSSGWSNYKYSAIRQWLNSSATANNWWTASHVGDTAPSYSDQAGFMNGLDANFKAILQRTEVVTVGNGETEPATTYSTYDYLFIPSIYETGGRDTPVEGEKMLYFWAGESNATTGLFARAHVNGVTDHWLLRSPVNLNVYNVYGVTYDGTHGVAQQYSVSSTRLIVPACKIILAGA